MEKKAFKVIFMGTPEFALPSLQSLIDDPDFEVVAVVTQEDKKFGREQKMAQPPVKTLAQKHNIPILQPEKVRKNPELITLVKSLKPDFIIVVSYGLLLPKRFLEIAKYGCINVHASLLPKYRGASPIQTAILNGDEVTGVTIMKMEEKLDQGGIFYIKKIPIEHADNTETLKIKLSLIAGTILPGVLKDIADGIYKDIAQDESQASHCKKITKNDGTIDLMNQTAEEIFNQIRAYTPWPSSFLMIDGKRIKILEADYDSTKNIEPGTAVNMEKDVLALGTKHGILIPKKIQMEGKKPLPIQEFLRGNKDLLTKLLTKPK